MYDILKVSGLVFEMVNSLEMYVIYCMTLVAMNIFRLRLTIRFASIAKSHWNGCMSDQFHQHDHSKLTFSKARVARASIFGLINARDIFIAKLHESSTICKGVFNRLNRRKHQDHRLSDGSAIRNISNRYLMNAQENTGLNNKSFYNDSCFNNPQYRSWPCCVRRIRKILLRSKNIAILRKVLVMHVPRACTVTGVFEHMRENRSDNVGFFGEAIAICFYIVGRKVPQSDLSSIYTRAIIS
jgi:hypothetical protein